MAFDCASGGCPGISSTGMLPKGVVGLSAGQSSRLMRTSSKSTPARWSARRHSSPRLTGASKYVNLGFVIAADVSRRYAREPFKSRTSCASCAFAASRGARKNASRGP